MHEITDIPAWDRLLKRIVWEQLGDVKNRKILDFGSGEGITACHFAKDNAVTAVEPWNEMLENAWADYEYRTINGGLEILKTMEADSFDLVICHNVLEYIDDKGEVIRELSRVLKPGGTLSIVKHNRAGRVMQMAVLLDDINKANDLLDGNDSAASKFGSIRYYGDADVTSWSRELKPVKTYGIRTFWDLQQNQEKHCDEEWQKKMAELEMRVSEIEEYKAVAFFHHLILTK